MKIGIIGAGNIGTAIAADLARKNDITIFSSRPNEFEKRLKYEDSSGEYEYYSKIKCITNDYKVVVENSELLFICLPTYAISNAIKNILPYINNNHIIGYVPGAGGVEFFSKKLLEKGATIFGFERVPYVARVKEYGKVVSASKKPKYRAATLPSAKGEEIAKLITSLFEVECGVMSEFISMTLTPTLHVSRLYDIYKDYQPNEILDSNPLFYKEWRDSASYICFEVDKELHEVANALTKKGLPTDELVPYSIHYESETPELLTKKLQSIPSLSKIKGPVIDEDGVYRLDIESRYFTESYPYRLAIVRGLADLLKMEVPLTTEILKWYERIANKQYFINDDFCGPDVKECNIPQNYGINSIEELINLYK